MCGIPFFSASGVTPSLPFEAIWETKCLVCGGFSCWSRDSVDVRAVDASSTDEACEVLCEAPGGIPARLFIRPGREKFSVTRSGGGTGSD